MADEARMHILNDELNRLESKMGIERASFGRVWALFSAFAGGSATFGLSERSSKTLLFLPVAVLMVGLVGLVVGREHLALGGYKRFVEEELNRASGNRGLALWESGVALKMDHRHVTPKVAVAIGFKFWVLQWILAFQVARGAEISLLVGAAVISLICVLIATIEFTRAHQRAYDAATFLAKGMQEPPDQSQ